MQNKVLPNYADSLVECELAKLTQSQRVSGMVVVERIYAG